MIGKGRKVGPKIQHGRRFQFHWQTVNQPNSKKGLPKPYTIQRSTPSFQLSEDRCDSYRPVVLLQTEAFGLLGNIEKQRPEEE